YIALADQDDIWEKDKIKTLLESIEGCIMVYHNSDFIDEYDRRIGNNTIASKHRMYEGESCLPIIIGNCIHGHSVLFDSKLKNYLFPFNNKFSHDWGIAYVAFNIGVVKYVDKVLVHYRQHQDTVTDFLERRKTGIIPRKPRKLERLSINVSWLKYCSKYKYNKEAALVSEAYTTVSNLKQGKNKFRSLIFLVKYFDLLFYTIGYKPRGFLSKVNFVRKLCFN
ncbi:MAG: hypothetical protein ACXVB6_13570, partial [Mucilaginibacter sp.]